VERESDLVKKVSDLEKQIKKINHQNLPYLYEAIRSINSREKANANATAKQTAEPTETTVNHIHNHYEIKERRNDEDSEDHRLRLAQVRYQQSLLANASNLNLMLGGNLPDQLNLNIAAEVRPFLLD